MGVALKELIRGEEITLQKLKGKVIVIDSFNLLYQFLTTIRARDGSLLTTSKGVVTSHLIGLFSRTSALLDAGVKPVFVFDGSPPKLKEKERAKRKEAKEKAKAKYSLAMKKEDVEGMKKYAARTTSLTGDMIDDAKKVITALGIPYVDAPSEGEAQAAFMVKRKDAYAVVSQDADSLLFGSTILIRNLSVLGRRKKIHGMGTTVVKPECLVLSDVLNELGIDGDGLIALSMLIGTDYNRGGIKGIGPKKGLALVKKHARDFDTLFEEVGWEKQFSMPWTEVFYLFKNIPVTEEYTLSWKTIDEVALENLLVEKYEFSKDRIQATLQKIKKHAEHGKQKGLGDFV